MKVFSKKWDLSLPLPIEKAWAFFSRPENLGKITPPEMQFRILNDISSIDMYEGMMIHYTVRPVWNIPMRWSTEITHIKEYKYFVDEQRAGPYALWHHEHHFKSDGLGVKMSDILHYALPFGMLGQVVNQLFVHQKIDGIFAYREKILKELFQ